MNTVVTILAKKALGDYKDKNKVNPNSDVSSIVIPSYRPIHDSILLFLRNGGTATLALHSRPLPC